VVKLIETSQALLRGCSAPAGTKTFLQLEGAKTANVVLMESHLGAAEQAAQSGPDVPKDAVTLSGNVCKTPT
jgi:hypothetical protein